MAAELTYRQLRRQVAALAKEIRQTTDVHKQTARVLDDEAKDTGRIAEHLCSLNVDPGTRIETREVARIMHGISEVALSYANAADEAHRAADAAGLQAMNDHGGIQEAVDRAPVSMAKSSWYTQE